MVLYLSLAATFLSLVRHLQVWDVLSVRRVTDDPIATGQHDLCVGAPSTTARIDWFDI